MPLRVIAGTARGRKLKQIPGDTTRPIMDRVKEALFSIIGQEITDATFLDLFAGTGSVGVEALSRGAQQVVFIEIDRKVIETIHENLKITKLGDRAIVRRMNAFAYLRRPPAKPFDFIYIAPPQYKGIWLEALQAIDTTPGWIGEYTEVIVQIDPKELRDINVALQNLEETDRRKYGRTMLLFYAGKTKLFAK